MAPWCCLQRLDSAWKNLKDKIWLFAKLLLNIESSSLTSLHHTRLQTFYCYKHSSLFVRDISVKENKVFDNDTRFSIISLVPQVSTT
jgi:hypothetical protein